MDSENRAATLAVFSFTNEQLEKWVKGVLKYDYLVPFQLYGGHESTALTLCDIWDLIDSPSSPLDPPKRIELQKRIKETVIRLLIDWVPPSDSPEYMSEILHTIGFLGCHNAYELLLEEALDQSLRRIEFESPGGKRLDLHRELLKVLFGMKTDKIGKDKEVLLTKIRKVIERDINRPAYSPLCLIHAGKIDPENSILYIRSLVKCALSDPRVYLRETLGDYHLTFGGFDSFCENFLKIRRSLLGSNIHVSQGDHLRFYASYLNAISDICTVRVEQKYQYYSISDKLKSSGFRILWHPSVRKKGVLSKPIPYYKFFEGEANLLKKVSSVFNYAQDANVSVRKAMQKNSKKQKIGHLTRRAAEASA